MFKLLNKIYIIGVLCLAATPAFAKVCFLPDGNCEAGKATYSPVNNITGCEYKDENAAKNGLGECQETYKSGICHYRRCKMSETECMKEAHEASHAKTDIKKKCVVCKDGCWKLVDSAYGPDTEHTCKEMGYKTKENCTADYVKFVPVNLIDKNGERCGVCDQLTCSQMGGYKTKASCGSNEEFESVDKIDAYGNICGNCKTKTDNNPSDPNNGKTYYVTIDKNVVLHYPGFGNCNFTVDGIMKLPDIGNDSFFKDNNIRFAAQVHAYANLECISNGCSGRYVTYLSKIASDISIADMDQYSDYEVPIMHSDNTDSNIPEWGCGASRVLDSGIDLNNSKYWILKGSETPDNTSSMSSNCQTITVDGNSRTICYRYKDYSEIEVKVYFAYYPSLMNSSKILDKSSGVPALFFKDTMEPYETKKFEYKKGEQKISLTMRQISSSKKSSYIVSLSKNLNQECEYRVMTKNEFESKGAYSTLMHTGEIAGGPNGTEYGGRVWRSFSNLRNIPAPDDFENPDRDSLEYVAVMACTSPEGNFSNRQNKCSEISSYYREYDDPVNICSMADREYVPNVYSFGVRNNIDIKSPCMICKNIR